MRISVQVGRMKNVDTTYSRNGFWILAELLGIPIDLYGWNPVTD